MYTSSGFHQISVEFKQSELNKFVPASIIYVAIRARMSWQACEACVWIELTVCWVILAVFCYFLWTSKRMNAEYQVDPSFQILSSQCLELSSNNSFQIPCGSTEINYIQLHGRYLTTKCFLCLCLFYDMDNPWAMYIQSELHSTAAGENGISMSKLRRLCHAQRHASSLRGNEKLFTWDLAVLNCATSQCHSKAQWDQRTWRCALWC